MSTAGRLLCNIYVYDHPSLAGYNYTDDTAVTVQATHFLSDLNLSIVCVRLQIYLFIKSKHYAILCGPKRQEVPGGWRRQISNEGG
jgi:hypothetical protein